MYIIKLLQTKIQTHMILYACLSLATKQALRTGRFKLTTSEEWQRMMIIHRTFTIKNIPGALDCRDVPPQPHRAPIYSGRKRVRRITTITTPVKPRGIIVNIDVTRCGAPRVVRRWAVVGGRVEVGAFGVLALALVGVLVAAEGLGGGEVAAAVVALEFPATAISGVSSVFRGGVGVVGGSSAATAAELDAKEADGGRRGGGLFFGRRGPDEGQLGEGLHIHEVVGFSL